VIKVEASRPPITSRASSARTGSASDRASIGAGWPGSTRASIVSVWPRELKEICARKNSHVIE
jgi:hypothetical protein